MIFLLLLTAVFIILAIATLSIIVVIILAAIDSHKENKTHGQENCYIARQY